MAVASVAIAVPLAPPSEAQVADRQSVRFELTTRQPGSPTGYRQVIAIRNPTDPKGKPYSLERMQVRLPAGGRIDTTVPVQCKATDAELIAGGESACPPRSRVGGGALVSDTGSSAGFPPRFVRNEVDLFNNEDELIGLADASNAPPLPPFDRVVVRSPIRRDGRVTTTTTTYPEFPGQPPPDTFLAVRDIRLDAEPIVRRGRGYATTPPTCARDDRWGATLVFTYRDGVTQRERSAAPCVPAPACRSSDATILGTAGDDALRGTRGRDVMLARGGDDRVKGRAGKDLICGGPGSDNIRGARGREQASGGGGRDSLRGGNGRDRLGGGKGSDVLRGGPGRDTLKGGGGRDRVNQ